MESDSKKTNLKAVENLNFKNQDPENSILSKETRRVVRVQLSSEQFRLNKTGKVFSVCDLSENGMGLYLIENEDRILFSLGNRVEGILNFKHQKYPVIGEVRNIHLNRIGIEFKELSQLVKSVLQRELSAVAIGMSLRLFPSSDQRSLWYRGSSGVDLIIKTNSQGDCTQIVLYVSERLIQWDLEQGFKTGIISLFTQEQIPTKGIQENGIFRLEDRKVKMDDEVNVEQLMIAKNIILSSILSQEFKKPWLFS